MRLVPNWKEAWRWFSVQFLAVLAFLPAVWVSLPDDTKAFLPSSYGPWVLTTLAVCGILGRIVDQNKAAGK